MVTDTYNKLGTDVSLRSALKSGDYGEDLGMLMRQQRQQHEAMSDREKELSLCRSGSAPPTVEGSLNAVGGIFNAYDLLGFNKSTGKGFISDEELRSDPAYVNYYYSNVNLNPRLPPPLLSKEDWRFAQRLHGGGTGGLGGIGDRWEGGRVVGGGGGGGGDEGVNGNGSLFMLQPGVGTNEDSGIESRRVGGDWTGDGLIGLPGLGLGSRKKSIAEILQDDLSNGISISRHPSRPTSRNAFDDTLEASESQFGYLHQDMATMGGNKQGMSAVQGVGASHPHTYASAVGASLSRTATPDPQLVARAPSPRIPPVGGGRVSSTVDKRNACGPNSFNGVSLKASESPDLVSSFSGMNLSSNGILGDESHLQSDIQQEIDDHRNFFNLQSEQNDMKMYLSHKNSESGKFHMHSPSQSTRGSHQNNSLVLGVDHAEFNKQAVSSPTSYMKGPYKQTLDNARGSPSHNQNIDNANSSFLNYGFGGYTTHPPVSSIVGTTHLGSGNLPPLYENAAAASAMGMSGMNTRAFSGLALGSNMLETANEFQKNNRLENHNAMNAMQLPALDPSYIQYLGSNDYAAAAAAAAQVAGISDPPLDGESLMGNGYMDLLGVQKAYLGALLSSQNSQYVLPYYGKSGSLNQNYYGNPGFGLGMSYPGSPLGGSLLPGSPVGSGNAINHISKALRFSSGMRNLAGGGMGGWHSEAGGNMNGGFVSSLLDEFKNNKSRCFELSEIAGHVFEFSSDQYGSRFIQQKLETASEEEKDMVFHEIMPQALSLMTDVFGNYVVQKFFEHGTASQIRELADQLNGHVLALSLQMYGCRVIQKAIEVVNVDQQTKMVTELDGHIMRCVRDQNGNHVVQKCIECIPEDAIQFIVSTFYDQVVTLSTHPYGCRVIQRVLEHCHNPKTQHIMMDEIFLNVCMLAQDQYGNYVVQHVLEHGKPHERSAIIKKLTGQIVQMSQQKFASNVIEKCLTFGTSAERQALVNEMLGTTDENEPLQVMMKDQFANYVVQKVLETCDDQQLELILNRIKVHLNALKKYTYGKHIVARVEKLVAAGERRISILTPKPAQMVG
ncbi:Pumilio-like 2, partial [Cucurbita argyrosperma subsp. argyrosperma]